MMRYVLALACVLCAGCFAARLSGRGAPAAAMRVITIDMDPVDLPVHRQHEQQTALEPKWIWIREAGWLHSWDYTLTDERGEALPKAALHHFKVLDADHRELFTEVMRHVIAAGEETAPVTLPGQIGYRVAAGDSLLVTGMLHNPTDQEWRGVHLQLKLRYSPEGQWKPPLDVIPFFAHVADDWESVSYDLPPGRSLASVDIVPAVDGRVLALGGHLHRYGVSLTLQSLPDHRVLWEGKANVANDGTVLDIPQDHFVWSRSPRLRHDRTYRLSAIYDNPTGDTIRDGGMATIGGIIVPDGPWPELDRTSEEYRWYLQRELDGTEDRHPDH